MLKKNYWCIPLEVRIRIDKDLIKSKKDQLRYTQQLQDCFYKAIKNVIANESLEFVSDEDLDNDEFCDYIFKKPKYKK